MPNETFSTIFKHCEFRRVFFSFLGEDWHKYDMITAMFPKELDGRINRIAAPVHQSREMSWEQQRNGTLGSPDKVYLDQRREIAFSASFASWGLSVIKTNGGPIRTKGFLCYYQGWYQLLSQAFVGANDALSSIPQDYYIHFSFHDVLHRNNQRRRPLWCKEVGPGNHDISLPREPKNEEKKTGDAF